MDATEHTKHVQWQAANAYAEHQLISDLYWSNGHGARWFIQKPGTGVYAAEIIAGICGSLVVHGDADLVRFAHYGDKADCWSRLLWMADCTDIDYYVAQKAAIGMADAEASRKYEPECARSYLREYIKEHEGDGDADEEMLDVLRRAVGHCYEQQDLRQFLWDEGSRWGLWELSPGIVTAPSVIYAHAALNKLASLLREKYGSGGPLA